MLRNKKFSTALISVLIVLVVVSFAFALGQLIARGMDVIAEGDLIAGEYELKVTVQSTGSNNGPFAVDVMRDGQLIYFEEFRNYQAGNSWTRNLGNQPAGHYELWIESPPGNEDRSDAVVEAVLNVTQNPNNPPPNQ